MRSRCDSNEFLPVKELAGKPVEVFLSSDNSASVDNEKVDTFTRDCVSGGKGATLHAAAPSQDGTKGSLSVTAAEAASLRTNGR